MNTNCLNVIRLPKKSVGKNVLTYELQTYIQPYDFRTGRHLRDDLVHGVSDSEATEARQVIQISEVEQLETVVPTTPVSKGQMQSGVSRSLPCKNMTQCYHPFLFFFFFEILEILKPEIYIWVLIILIFTDWQFIKKKFCVCDSQLVGHLFLTSGIQSSPFIAVENICLLVK